MGQPVSLQSRCMCWDSTHVHNFLYIDKNLNPATDTQLNN